MSASTHIYDDLGVTPVINAIGNRTLLGGNTPSEVVRAAMDESEDYYVDMRELSDRIGERISDMLGIEAALVTSGASASLALGAAACMTGTDVDKIEQVPDVTGMPHEFIIQKGLRVKYDRCMTIPGGKLVEVGDEDGTRPEHIEEAIGPNTAGIHYLARPVPEPGTLPIEEVLEIAHSHDIPIVMDAAGRVYPTEFLSTYVKMGVDLVAYGAKYFGSVNSSGLLTGRKDLVEAAGMHSFIGFESSPVRSFGRPMKMDRQEVVAVYAALKAWLTMDHEERLAMVDARIDALRADLRDVASLSFVAVPEGQPGHDLWMRVDAEAAGKTADEVVQELRAGNPSIWVRQDGDEHHFSLNFIALKEGGERVIADRLREVL